MKQHLVWYVLYFTRYQVRPFFGDVQLKFVLSDQDGVLVRHLSFLEKKIICGHFQAPGRF